MRTIILFLSICIAQMVVAQSGITLSGGIDVFKPITGKGEILGHPDLRRSSDGAFGGGVEVYQGIHRKVYFSTYLGVARENYQITKVAVANNAISYKYKYARLSQAIHIKSVTNNPEIWWHMTAGAGIKYGTLSFAEQVSAERQFQNIDQVKDIEFFLGLGFLHPFLNIGHLNYTFGMHIAPFDKKVGVDPGMTVQHNIDPYCISKGYPILKVRYIPYINQNKNHWSRSCI